MTLRLTSTASNANPGFVRPFAPVAALLTSAALLLMTPALPALAQEIDPVTTGPGSGPPGSFADLAESLLPAVVNISTEQLVDPGGRRGLEIPEFPPGSPFRDFFDDFGGPRPQQAPPRRATALGSGFIIDSSGVVITNNHVIEGAETITVGLQDGETLEAELVGVDPETDIAVLRVEPEGELPSVEWGDSSTARVGDWVIAIGNPFGLGGSVSAGIVSARGRDIQAGRYDDFIQTDAAINRGNSGGPLFDMSGQVVGINSAIYSPTGSSVGIGFAIPSNLAQQVTDQILEFGRTRRGWLGVRIQTVTEEIAESLGLEEARGALVAGVTEGSPAEEAGIEVGDVILEFNGSEVEEMRNLPRAVAETEVGSEAEVRVFRNGEMESLSITLGELETSVDASPTLTPDPEGPAVERDLDTLGLSLAPLTDETRRNFGIDSATMGVVITDVVAGSPAEQEGLAPGEVIVEVGQEPVSSPADVAERVQASRDAGRRSVLLLVDREGQLRFVALSIGPN